MGPFKLLMRQAGSQGGRARHLEVWACVYILAFLQNGGMNAHRKTHTWAHANPKAHLRGTMCTHKHGPIHMHQNTDAHPDV